MSIEIKVPDLPESVADATVAAWSVNVGDQVNKEQNILELETDKVVLEVPAPASGTLSKIQIDAGETVVGGDILGVIEEGEVSKTASKQAKPATEEISEEQAATNDVANASPSVRKMMNENNLSEADVTGSGKHGKILKQDVEKALNQSVSAKTDKATTQKPDTQSLPQATDLSDRIEERVPMTRLRARIAERLLDAQSSAAILTTFNEVDLTEVSRLRKAYQERFQKIHGVKLGFMSFFIKAATEALKRFPEVNARIDGNDIIYQGFYDIGVAVSTERGLVVPILRNTDSLGNADIEKQIADFAARARNGQLEMDELTGGTFSITNGGVFGSMLSTPIINPPQSAILGMHSIQQRPVAINGEVVIRPMMYLALSYDHRLVDGQGAVSFLVKLKELLEDPASLFLEL